MEFSSEECSSSESGWTMYLASPVHDDDDDDDDNGDGEVEDGVGEDATRKISNDDDDEDDDSMASDASSGPAYCNHSSYKGNGKGSKIKVETKKEEKKAKGSKKGQGSSKGRKTKTDK